MRHVLSPLSYDRNVICSLCLAHLLLCPYVNKKEKLQYWLAFVLPPCYCSRDDLTYSIPVATGVSSERLVFPHVTTPCLEVPWELGRLPSGRTRGHIFLQIDVWASRGLGTDQGSLPCVIAVRGRAAICKHMQGSQAA